MSRKNDIHLFKAIVDDLARALVQQLSYFELLEKGITRRGSNKMVLLLRATRCQLSLVVLAKDIDRYATEFHNNEAHLARGVH